MKKCIALGLLFASDVLFPKSTYANINKCIPEYAATVLSQGSLQKLQKEENGAYDFVIKDIGPEKGRRYGLHVDEKPIHEYSQQIESTLISVKKENLTTQWLPSNDPSKEACEITIRDKDGNPQTVVKLFPHAYTPPL